MSENTEDFEAQVQESQRSYAEQQAAKKAVQREEYGREYARAQAEVIDAVTRLGKLRHPEHGQPDIAGFLGSTLASAAANLGSTAALLAGRPGRGRPTRWGGWCRARSVRTTST